MFSRRISCTNAYATSSAISAQLHFRETAGDGLAGPDGQLVPRGMPSAQPHATSIWPNVGRRPSSGAGRVWAPFPLEPPISADSDARKTITFVHVYAYLRTRSQSSSSYPGTRPAVRVAAGGNKGRCFRGGQSVAVFGRPAPRTFQGGRRRATPTKPGCHTSHRRLAGFLPRRGPAGARSLFPFGGSGARKSSHRGPSPRPSCRDIRAVPLGRTSLSLLLVFDSDVPRLQGRGSGTYIPPINSNVSQ